MNEHPVTILDLAAYLAGDMSDIEWRKTGDHLESCESCRKKLASLERERVDFLRAHPFDERRFQPPAAKQRRMVMFPVHRNVFALAASLLLVVGATTSFISLHNNSRGFRTKGNAVDLSLYVLGGSGKPEQRKSAVYYPEEQIQFSYSLSHASYFVLLSLDSAGKSTIYYPESGESAVMLKAGADIPLPNSIILDSFTGPEIFLGIFADNPVSASDISRQLTAEYQKSRSFGMLPAICKGTAVRSFIIEKKSKDAP